MSTVSSLQGSSAPPNLRCLQKAPTGISGFDAISLGGLPRGRTTLVTGSAGAGKTLFAAEFLLRGILEFNEPGVLVAFEESVDDITTNMASLGFDLPALIAEGKLHVELCKIRASEIVTTGPFDLEGLFVRLEAAVQKVGAQRMALDTVEVLLSAFGNEAIVRGELARLFDWLKERGLTSVITGERGHRGELSRYGIEEYVSDCVIALDHRVQDEVSTRRLRVVKYRGSMHGTNEYPFLITERGFMVLPITTIGLNYNASDERIPTGISELDRMLRGGIFRGSTMLVTGTAGTGKTTVMAHLVNAACQRGERALVVSFEESPNQIVRNLRSVGIDLGPWLQNGQLQIWAERASAMGLEEHLGRLERLLDDFHPDVVALDAIGSLSHVGHDRSVTATLEREIDLMKTRGITAVLTSLSRESELEQSSVGVTSITDTWLLLRNVESDGERNRLLFVIKSRGMAHSNQVREFLITDQGAELVDVAVGSNGVLTGSARRLYQAQRELAASRRQASIRQHQLALARSRAEMEAQIKTLQGQINALQARIKEETALVEAQASDEQQEQDAETNAFFDLEQARRGSA